MIYFLMAFILLFFYLHLYVHFIVNPNNQCLIVSEMTQENISDHVYQMQPFLLDASHFPKVPVQKETEDVLRYTPVPVLEPYVRFYTRRKVTCSPKKKKWIETTDACRTFYRICKGSFHVTCIHPDKKEGIPTKSLKQLKKNEDLIQLTLHEDSLLFLPNRWSLYLESLEDGSRIEKLQYYTPLNLVANTISKIPKYIDDTISTCSMNEPPFI